MGADIAFNFTYLIVNSLKYIQLKQRFIKDGANFELKAITLSWHLHSTPIDPRFNRDYTFTKYQTYLHQTFIQRRSLPRFSWINMYLTKFFSSHPDRTAIAP